MPLKVNLRCHVSVMSTLVVHPSRLTFNNRQDGRLDGFRQMLRCPPHGCAQCLRDADAVSPRKKPPNGAASFAEREGMLCHSLSDASEYEHSGATHAKE